jgi:hypothetical protein
MLQLFSVHKFNLITHNRGTAQADFIAASHLEAVLCYARGEQHLYHFNPILVLQSDTFRDAPRAGLMENPKRFALFVYTWIAKVPIPDKEMVRVI